MQILIFNMFGLNMLIHAHKMGFIGGLPYKYGVASL